MNKIENSNVPRTAFLTTYDVRTGIELFERQDRGFLKYLAKLMNVWILTVLSARCFHQWGGAKMMLRERWRTWVKAGLSFKVHHVENAIKSIIALVAKAKEHRNSQSIPNSPKSSVPYGHNMNRKGISICIKQFS